MGLGLWLIFRRGLYSHTLPGGRFTCLLKSGFVYSNELMKHGRRDGCLLL